LKTALLLVDIQNDYFPGGANPLVGIDDAGKNAAAVLNLFREKKLLVFHIQHISIRKGATFFLPDTKGVEIHESVKPLPTEETIQKKFPNSFRRTSLLDRLKEKEIEKVIIFGAMSHMCIDATTRTAFDLGFSCTVIEDACATKDLVFGNKTIPAEHVHGAFMAALGPVYAQISTTKNFIENFE
jgi:nicotinamidase-related amidase